MFEGKHSITDGAVQLGDAPHWSEGTT